jgi:hypothetical protein
LCETHGGFAALWIWNLCGREDYFSEKDQAQNRIENRIVSYSIQEYGLYGVCVAVCFGSTVGQRAIKLVIMVLVEHSSTVLIVQAFGAITNDSLQRIWKYKGQMEFCTTSMNICGGEEQ